VKNICPYIYNKTLIPHFTDFSFELSIQWKGGFEPVTISQGIDLLKQFNLEDYYEV